MKQEFKENFVWYFVTKVFMPVFLVLGVSFLLDKSARENSVMESYFRDINSLITNEYTYDELSDRCVSLQEEIKKSQEKKTRDMFQQKFEKLECNEHTTKDEKSKYTSKYAPQTNIVRNTAGARTILALNELTDENNKSRIKDFIKVAGICEWIEKESKDKYKIDCNK